MIDPNLKHVAAEKFKPFQEDILSRYPDNIHSITIIGSSLTDDFDPENSDINSVFVLNRMDLKFLELLAPLGKKYRKKKVAAPLIIERELKVTLIGLRQGYIASMGDRKMLSNMFADSFSGYIPLFRGILLVLGKQVPVQNDDVLSALEEVSGIDVHIFRTIGKQKRQKLKPTAEQLNAIFKDCYMAIEKLGDMTDEIHQ
ncbi:MAG: hypothetical protein JRE58_02465 [Deltaproteobacteria bacterium]|nr:hypothetical protein [Deltaproteobacteria bacterium]